MLCVATSILINILDNGRDQFELGAHCCINGSKTQCTDKKDKNTSFVSLEESQQVQDKNLNNPISP